MKRLTVILLGMVVVVGLAGCSLPGRTFSGGPSPWLPGGAPGSVYAPPSATQPAPHPATQDRPAEQVPAK